MTKQQPIDNTQKDPDTWKTGEEPITGAQKSYIETLSSMTDEDIDTDGMTKAEAADVIERLQKKTGREDTS